MKNNYLERLNKLIPGGAHTYSRGHDQFPINAPKILNSGEGAYVFTPSGEKFLDYGMALRAVNLGYANKEVNDAAIDAIKKGNNLTKPSLIELEAAELITDLIDSADMVKFCKNGSNATTAAVKIARAYTNKRFICIPKEHPFFSFDDWFIGKTEIKRGIPEPEKINTLIFEYNNIQSLQKLFDEHPNDIACVILEPATTVTPCPVKCKTSNVINCRECPNNGENFLNKVKKLCKEHDSIFILDEMITGFRWHLKGAQFLFGVEPDLSTFGKAMANGFSLSAVTGKREFMSVGSIEKEGQERTFLLSSTHGGEMCSLAAFISTVNQIETTDCINKLWQYGKNLREIFNTHIKNFQLEDYFEITGPDICLNYIARNHNKEVSMDFRTLFAQEMIKHKVLMPWIAVSNSHGKRELEITDTAINAALEVYRKAIDGKISDYLLGPSIKPVFRKFN